MAPTTKQADIFTVWASLARLLDALTKLAENANRSIDEDRAKGK